jgi:putative heme-binding domain-containing protein
LRNEAVGALLNRIERVPSVVHALESGQVRPTDLASWQINLLRAFRDPAIAQRAVQVFGPVRPERPEVLSAARPALRLAGNAPRGRSLFLGRCAACHRLKGEGWSVGPDLAGLKPAGKEAMLAAILQPSAQLAAGYETQVVEAANGELAVGVISANHGNAGIELTQPGGVRTVWARAGIQHVQAQPWSLMPDGLENGLTAQDLADLLDYIFSAPAR